MLRSSLLIILAQGVQVCEWGKYGHNCDRLCSDHCGFYLGTKLRPCHKYTGKCLQGCVRGWHGDHCDQLCSLNCISTTCNKANGGCTIGCVEGHSGYFCNITTGTQIQTTVSTVQGVPVCEWGKYGQNCDRLCSDHCGFYLGTKLRPCHKYNGKCLQGCVHGWHGDHCDQLCSPNCISAICNQGNGGCTIGCTDGHSGYFCNITTGTQIQTTVSTVQDVPVCEWGKYGDNCDRLCSDQCRLHPVRNLRPCHKYTGKCFEGCVRGRHGDQCDQLCSPNCINNSCIQLNGGCTIGCMEGYNGYFCNTTTGSQTRTTVSAVQGVPVCEWGKYGDNCDRLCSEHCGLYPVRKLRPCDKDTGKCLEGCVRGRHGDQCDQLCSPNCIDTKCNQPNGGCTLGCMDGYIGQFCNRTTGSQIQTTGEGHINLSMQLMWMLLVFFIFSTVCCWKSARCRRTLDEWLTRLMRRNPRPSSSDPSQMPLVTTQDSDHHASSDPSKDHSQTKRVPRLSTASHATPSPADHDLFYATKAGDLKEVKRILSTAGVNVNCRVLGKTPVMEAAWYRYREVMELLVNEGADVSLADKYGNNNLHFACMGGDVETVKIVLSRNVVDINSRGQERRTPVMMAACYGHKDVVELLVSKGADMSLVDKYGNNTLHLACLGEDVETVKFVLSLNLMDIDSMNKQDETAADLARLEHHQQALDLLVSHGAQ